MQTRYPDSYYQERYGCTWSEYLQRIANGQRYDEYSEPSEAFLTRSVGVPFTRHGDYATECLVEVREQPTPPNSRVAKHAKTVYYSAGETLLMTEVHTYYRDRTITHCTCTPGQAPPRDLPVTDVVLMRERLLDRGYVRRIVGRSKDNTGVSKLTLQEQLAGKTRLEPTLQPKMKCNEDGTEQVTLDLCMVAA